MPSVTAVPGMRPRAGRRNALLGIFYAVLSFFVVAVLSALSPPDVLSVLDGLFG
jgi:branched-subunit amino acid transport protein